MSQYDLNVIIEKIQNKSLFEHKENRRSRPRTLKVVISKLYYSQNYMEKPQAARKKVTELMLYHGQFTKEEVDEIFKNAIKRTTEYSNEFLEQHPELSESKNSMSREGPIKENENLEEKMVLEEIKYVFPHYA